MAGLPHATLFESSPHEGAYIGTLPWNHEGAEEQPCRGTTRIRDKPTDAVKRQAQPR